MPALSPESVLVRNERLSWRVLGDSAVILFPDVGTLHRLNATGTRLWEAIDGERDLDSVASLLCSEFEVAHDVAVADAQRLAAELRDAGLVETRT